MAAGRKAVLIVEDEPDLAETLRVHLQREGFACRCAADGRTALSEVRRTAPDLVVLDRMLPGMSGDDVIAEMKRERATASIPVIMMTAKCEESDELVGFALGADDYVRKPVSLKLLSARVSALLRRDTAATGPKEVLASGPIRVDAGRHEVRVDGSAVDLTATEFAILRALMSADGRVMQRERLIDIARGTDVAVTPRTIDAHIAAVRRKLGAAGSWIRTIRGVGYTFRDPGDDVSEGGE